jgi:hypothetical protein
LTISIGASKDATIYGGTVNNSNGAGPGMFSGTDGTPSKLRALIDFDLSSVPSGATITNVQLTLFLGMVPGGSGGPVNSTIGLNKIAAFWNEGTTGSTATMIGGTGAGFPANDGDATWNARLFSATTPTLWTTLGGDYPASASASAIVGNTLNVGYTWNSTAALVADVQSWLNTPASNFGWMLVNADETSSRTFRAFFTREASNTAMRPQLQITYAVPEPSGIVLSILAACFASLKFKKQFN